jgi:ribosomal protein L16 Arg81 hydroxylase
MKRYELDDVVGDSGSFLAGSFNIKPQYFRQTMTGRLDGLPGLEMLDDLLALETVPASYLRLTKGGVTVPRQAYTRAAGREGAVTEVIATEKVYELFRLGATLTWNSVEHILPAVRQLLYPFAREFAARADAVLFVTPAGHDGFDPHHDSTDSFVVQLAGTKRWRVWNTPRPRLGLAGPDPAEGLGEPGLVQTLHPGDVLYVPHGTPHAAAAQDSISVHLSIGLEARPWRDHLRAVVDRLLADDEYREVPGLAAGHDEARAARQLAGLIGALREQLGRLDPAQTVSRLISDRQAASLPTPAREIERLSAADAIVAGSLLRRSPLPLTFGERADSKVAMAVNGHTVTLPAALQPTVTALDAGRSIPAADIFRDVAAERSVLVAQRLTRLGVLEVVALEAELAD